MTETETATTNEAEKKTKAEDISPEKLSKIDRQINYYFGDYNFPRDKFLQQQAQLDDGWVPLEVMLKCARLKALTEDPEAVLLALSSSKENLLEVSADKKKVRRNRPAPNVNEEAQLATMSRTVYCKGFKLDEQLDNLLEYFAKFGDCETVLMRNYRDKDTKTMKFKGSVFVVFKTDKLAKKFMDEEKVVHNETELIRKWQSDYVEEKKKEREEKQATRKHKHNDNEGVKKEDDDNIVLPTKSTVSVKEIPGDVTREDIKAAFLAACDNVKIAFIDFEKGNTDATVRFCDQDSSVKVIEALGEGSKVKVCGVDLPVAALTEEEEKPVLEKAEKVLNSKRMFNPRGKGGFKRGKRKGGRGGRGGYRGKRARHD